MPKLAIKCVSEGFNLACAPAVFAPGRAEKQCFFCCLLAKKPVHRMLGAPADAENLVETRPHSQSKFTPEMRFFTLEMRLLTLEIRPHFQGNFTLEMRLFTLEIRLLAKK